MLFSMQDHPKQMHLTSDCQQQVMNRPASGKQQHKRAQLYGLRTRRIPGRQTDRQARSDRQLYKHTHPASHCGHQGPHHAEGCEKWGQGVGGR